MNEIAHILARSKTLFVAAGTLAVGGAYYGYRIARAGPE